MRLTARLAARDPREPDQHPVRVGLEDDDRLLGYLLFATYAEAMEFLELFESIGTIGGDRP